MPAADPLLPGFDGSGMLSGPGEGSRSRLFCFARLAPAVTVSAECNVFEAKVEQSPGQHAGTRTPSALTAALPYNKRKLSRAFVFRRPKVVLVGKTRVALRN